MNFKGKDQPIWRNDYERSLPILQTYKKELEKNGIPKVDVKIMKANQLDSLALDEEVFSLLQAQLFKCFKFFKKGLLTEYKPEINTLLNLILFKLSIYDTDSSYGQKLQNLMYVNNFSNDPNNRKLRMWQKICFALLTIFGKWFWDRLNHLSIKQSWAHRPQSNWRKRVSDWMTKLEKIYKGLVMINLMVFFYESKYISLISRLLGMRLVYNTKNISKSLNFEYMNRQLVWHGFTEFLLVAIPLINFERIKSFFVKNFSLRKSSSSSDGKSSTSSEDICLVCSNEVTNPYVTNCNHTFCYYCIKTESMLNSTLKCPDCSLQITKFERKVYV